MKKFKKPKIEILRFEGTDIICTSSKEEEDPGEKNLKKVKIAFN